MALSIKHKFVCAVPDGSDTTIVRPSNWNDEHEFTGFAPSRLNGFYGASDGGTPPLPGPTLQGIIDAFLAESGAPEASIFCVYIGTELAGTFTIPPFVVSPTFAAPSLAGTTFLLNATFGSVVAPFNNDYSNLSGMAAKFIVSSGQLGAAVSQGFGYAPVSFGRSNAVEFTINAISSNTIMINTASSTAHNVDNYRIDFAGSGSSRTVQFARVVSSTLTNIGSAIGVGTGVGTYKITFDATNVYLYKNNSLIGTFATNHHSAFTRVGVSVNVGDLLDNIRVY